jgi:hypothetical protein
MTGLPQFFPDLGIESAQADTFLDRTIGTVEQIPGLGMKRIIVHAGSRSMQAGARDLSATGAYGQGLGR